MIPWHTDVAHFQRMIDQIEAFKVTHQGQRIMRSTNTRNESVLWSTLCNQALQYYKLWHLRALQNV